VEAVNAQIRVIKTLYRSNESEKQTLVEWTERFDEILKKACLVIGYDTDSTTWEREKEANRLSNKLYDELEWEIWSYLHELGYFKPGKKYGPDLKEIDTEESVEI